jgi:hypothetical protein
MVEAQPPISFSHRTRGRAQVGVTARGKETRSLDLRSGSSWWVPGDVDAGSPQSAASGQGDLRLDRGHGLLDGSHGTLFPFQAPAWPRSGAKRLVGISRLDVEAFLQRMRADGVGEPTIAGAFRVLRAALAKGRARRPHRRQPHPRSEGPQARRQGTSGAVGRGARAGRRCGLGPLPGTGPAARILRPSDRRGCSPAPVGRGLPAPLREHHQGLERTRVRPGARPDQDPAWPGGRRPGVGHRGDGPSRSGVPALIGRPAVHQPSRGAIRQSNFNRKVWGPALVRAKIAAPLPRVHDLRHTASALSVSVGAHSKEIQSLLGHANIGMTWTPTGTCSPGPRVAWPTGWTMPGKRCSPLRLRNRCGTRAERDRRGRSAG